MTQSFEKIFAALLAFLTLAAFACSSGGDDDDSSGSGTDDDADDDATSDDDTIDDDDADDDSDDDSTDDDADDDDGVGHPYTPCCDVGPDALAMDDPDLPANGEGPFGFSIIQRDFVDDERNRTIPADVYFPTGGNGPYPVVLVIHGFSGFASMMKPYGERLATWGYIAVAPSLPYTSPLGLGKFSNKDSAIDMLFILNSICCENDFSESPFFGLVDRARLGAVGHSMGGKLSVIASTYDDALGAVMGLDPVDGSGPIDFNDPENFPEIAPDLAPLLRVPTLYLGGELSGTPGFGGACAPVDDNYHEIWTYSSPPSVEITMLGADHTDFINPIPLDPCDLGTADPAIVKALALEYSVAFLNDTLRGWTRFHADYAGAGTDEDAEAGYVTWQEK